MFKTKSKILRKLGAGFMAGLCAFSMLGSSVSGVITANAAGNSTQNSAFPSADMVIAKAATLLGSPYTFGNKGYWYAYNQGQFEVEIRDNNLYFFIITNRSEKKMLFSSSLNTGFDKLCDSLIKCIMTDVKKQIPKKFLKAKGFL